MQYFTRVFQNYANFNGRDSRKQYWMFVLINVIVSFVLGFVAGLILGDAGIYVGYLYSLAILVPSIAIGVRRLHDIGKSGWWYLLIFVPGVGAIVLIIFFCMPSEEGTNAYGDMPEEM